jgi:hypothetical protein
MGIDKNTYHACGFVVLDEAHATHVSRQIEYLMESVHGLIAILSQAEIQNKVIRIIRQLIPLIHRLDIHSPDPVPLSHKLLHKMASYESTCTGYDDSFHISFRSYVKPGH